ncbi:c-type cytochrome [Dokdonia ponticola]|uniref:C-type cytochrome n=1 Tax=Dokdonia ponticola TaxID=2041041 RepID=A0ABV9HVT2_9FLAO
MKDNTVLIYAVTLIGIALLSYILWNLDYSEQATEESIVENQLFCGTISSYPSPSTLLEEEGNYLFKANCAACHRMYKRATGPALFESMKKFSSDSLLLFYLKKDKLVGEYGAPCISFPSLTYKDAEALRAYINLYTD